MTTLSELRGLSERATPGEWEASSRVVLAGPPVVFTDGLSRTQIALFAGLKSRDDAGAIANSAFAAACVNEIRRQLSEGEAGDANRERVAFAVVRHDGEVSPLGWMPMNHYESALQVMTLADGWRYLFAYYDAALSAQHQGERSE